MRIATRSSALALAQSGIVAVDLGGAELVKAETDTTTDDKERFVRGVERAVLDGQAEAGVHSAKDLPGEMTSGLVIAAVPNREDPRDAWIGPGTGLDDVPEGARVGTVSLRRRSQLLAIRPDLEPVALEGNVDTRLRKLEAGEADAIILAVAGLNRLNREDVISFAIPLDQMTPAAGQGALVVQSKAGGDEVVRQLNHLASERELLAERAAVVGLGADCSSPVGIHARHEGDRLVVDGFVGLADGSTWVRDRLEGDPAHPEAVGAELARRMSVAGATEILERATATA
ncbi:MAG: hydroxymethylbilane synthase [Solirubrobacterales bacterium]|nr:hydroxymethylbilane synthase [Solirubrobacterales bacterium]